VVAGFQVSISGRFWVSTEAPADALRSRGAFGEYGVPRAEGTAAAALNISLCRRTTASNAIPSMPSACSPRYSQHL